MTNEQFIYQNLTPSQNLDILSSLILKEIVRLAPYDARTNAILSRISSGYLCQMEIKGSQFRTIVNQFESRAEKALEKTRAEVLTQLARWKDQRFSNPMLTVLEERGPPDDSKEGAKTIHRLPRRYTIHSNVIRSLVKKVS